MSVSLVIKECRRCYAVYYDGKDITLENGDEVEIINARVNACPYCPDSTQPRGPTRNVRSY